MKKLTIDEVLPNHTDQGNLGKILGNKDKVALEEFLLSKKDELLQKEIDYKYLYYYFCNTFEL